MPHGVSPARLEERARPKPKCGAKAATTGKSCLRPAGWGTLHPGEGRCRFHGGASPQAQLKGAVEVARKELHMRMGDGLPIHPIAAILKCISIANAEVDYWSRRVIELEEEQLAAPVVTTRPLKLEKGAESSTERVEEHGPTELNIAIKARHQAMDRLTHYSNVALKAGIAERQVRIAEQQAQLISTALRGILSDLGVSNHPEAPQVVRRHLALLSAGQARDTVEAEAMPT